MAVDWSIWPRLQSDGHQDAFEHNIVAVVQSESYLRRKAIAIIVRVLIFLFHVLSHILPVPLPLPPYPIMPGLPDEGRCLPRNTYIIPFTFIEHRPNPNAQAFVRCHSQRSQIFPHVLSPTIIELIGESPPSNRKHPGIPLSA